jgi:hypothetical protein
MARGTGFARETLARIDAQVVSVIAADVRAAMEQGAVRAFDPEIVAEFIVGGIEKIVIRALDDGRTIDVTRIARDIAVLVSSGLVPATTVRRHALGVLAGRAAVPGRTPVTCSPYRGPGHHAGAGSATHRMVPCRPPRPLRCQLDSRPMARMRPTQGQPNAGTTPVIRRRGGCGLGKAEIERHSP